MKCVDVPNSVCYFYFSLFGLLWIDWSVIRRLPFIFILNLLTFIFTVEVKFNKGYIQAKITSLSPMKGHVREKQFFCILLVKSQQPPNSTL